MEQKVGENPSFQGEEGNDQGNRKASLVPNTRCTDLTHLPVAAMGGGSAPSPHALKNRGASHTLALAPFVSV